MVKKIAVVEPAPKKVLEFSWAVNPLKLERAKAKVQEAFKANPLADTSEEAIKAEYVKMAGLLQ